MTPPEVIRMLCYTIGVPTAAYIALIQYHAGARVWSAIFAAQSALWLWYMAEITMIGMGINTREYRIIGTPMILIITVAMVMIARSMRRHHHAAKHNTSHSKDIAAGEDAGAG